MKLKGKLITSFTTVVILAMLAFGGITYYTLANAINGSSESIIELQAEKTILKAHSKLHHKVISLVNRLAGNIDKILDHKISADKAALILQKTAVNEPLIDAVYCYNNKDRELFPANTIKNPSDFINILAKAASSEKAEDGVWFMFNKKLYLLFLMNEMEDKESILVEINQQAFRNYMNSLFTIESSVIYLSHGDESFIPPIRGKKRQEPVPTLKTINTMIPQTLAGKLSSLGRAYRPPTKLFGTTVTFLIPNKFFNTNLISLKNRLITAMIIVGWCAVWIILILANSIASPIRKLTKLTKDIIAFNYSSELEVKPSKDEIGDLAVNFETMRLKIKDLVTKDQLTHVYNRRFLMHVFELAVLRALRLNEKLSCIMIDIDYFKKVNDTYGHQAGDAVLVEMGKMLLDHTRDYDTPARYGGEEFILVLPDTALETAHEISERIRKAMQNMVVYFEDQQITCTLSLGISQLNQYTANTTEKIINHADSALYEAKESGRNQTVIYKDQS
jgi:diguanylate cyclase (GGDEF)-like protein